MIQQSKSHIHVKCINDPTVSYHNPSTSVREFEVYRIIGLEKVANNIPDLFFNLEKVTTSHISF